MNYWITRITSSVKLVQLTYFLSAELSYIISFSVVKAMKCSLFGNTDIEAVFNLTALVILKKFLNNI